MPNTARVVSKYVTDGKRNAMEIVTLASVAGIAFTNVTEEMTLVGDGDPVVVEINGLSNAQLTALRSRTEIAVLIDRDDDGEYADAGLTRNQIRAVATRLNELFGIPLARIAQYIDENDGTMTRVKAERLIRRLCKEMRN